jgi:hypothetical protein
VLFARPIQWNLPTGYGKVHRIPVGTPSPFGRWLASSTGLEAYGTNPEVAELCRCALAQRLRCGAPLDDVEVSSDKSFAEVAR